MSYTQIAFLAVAAAVTLDLTITKTRLLKKAVFWSSYAIILPFQFLTNWWLTSRDIVTYNPNVIIGIHIFSAPAEDILFGFALILAVLSLWIYSGDGARANRS